MNVLFASAEAAPFAKVGGLADVVGSLPQALRRLDVDARVIMPFYGAIDTEKHQIVPYFSFEFSRPVGTANVQVYTTTSDGVPFYFVQAWPHFHPGDRNIYTTWDWDVPRFIFFCQVAMAVAWELRVREGWFPDVWNVNDWHTALLPFLIDFSRYNPEWKDVGVVLTVHNAGEQYQGQSVGGWLWELGVPARTDPNLVYYDLTDNTLGIGIAYSDYIVPVSPRYATEIHYPNISGRLAGLVHARTHAVQGILNGLDVKTWNPETDPLLVSNYNAENFREKRPPNKAQLQEDAGLEVRADVPVIGIVSRLVQQKGYDLALPALRRLLVSTDVQLVVLGSGEQELEHGFWRLGQDFSWRAKVYQGYNAALAQRIYAGSDIFLMPSHYEPCGIGQMIAMRYGSLPLVRETGGLADTVENYDNGPADHGTGFVFSWEEPEAVLNTLRWAIDTYRNRPDAWVRMQKRGMERDFSWDSSAQRYLALYQETISKRKGTVQS